MASESSTAILKDVNHSNENSISTKEFLQFEKTCEAYKDSDEEIKLIFSEIKKLSEANNNDNLIGDDSDDVELILKRAEDIATETKNLLKCSPVARVLNSSPNCDTNGVIPIIKVTDANEIHNGYVTDQNQNATGTTSVKVIQPQKQTKDGASEVRRKTKSRPYSAGVIETKKKDSAKVTRFTGSPKKVACKHEPLIEELKDTKRARTLELANVQLLDDNRALRKKLDQINEQKHIAELKVAECEKFISRLGKEYENRNTELKAVKESESRIHAELAKERNERKNLTLRHEKDTITIHDLQRQVKEVEMILRRKHPDSVSALIVASKTSTMEDNKKKLLEERIARLEQELKDKETHFQGILLTLQEKFGDMKQKYESHIIDVERQLMEDRKVNAELKNRLNKTNLVDTAMQTSPRPLQSIGSQTFLKPDRASSAASRLSQNSAILINKLKEDSYLVATIKGLQAELTVKQRTIAKINRETEELKKNLRNMHKEKEVLMNLNPQQKRTPSKQAKSSDNILARINTEMEAELLEAKRLKEECQQEKNNLMESLKRANEDFILLKKKRIQDLHTLQLAHEKELMQMNMQIYPLQEEIKLLNRTVEILQDKLRDADDKLLRLQYGGKQPTMNAGGDNPGASKGRREMR